MDTHPAGQGSAPTQPQLLLVEDALDLAAVIQKELMTAGYGVAHAPTGESALQLAAQREFSLIILDWMLPGIDGLAVVRELRAASIVPILMLTARDSELDRVLGLEVGADDYLTKPFSMRELVTRVHALLRRRAMIERVLLADRQLKQTPVVVDQLQLNPEQQSMTIQGQAIDLTRTEFALLALLVNNPGRVFSRDYLLDAIWGADYTEGDRAVDNTILRLRKKLQAMSQAIETVWGVGYRWQRA